MSFAFRVGSADEEASAPDHANIAESQAGTMERERSRIDPEGRYPAYDLRTVETWALLVLDALPGASLERTRDVIQIEWGGESGIVVLVTPEAVELRLPTVEWTAGAHGPADSSRLWKRVLMDELEEVNLRDMLHQAHRAREQQFRKCRYCGRLVPPEHRFSEDVCHGCASEYRGIVF